MGLEALGKRKRTARILERERIETRSKKGNIPPTGLYVSLLGLVVTAVVAADMEVGL
jgi:hypothetical protein